jgi:hypothetical protein
MILAGASAALGERAMALPAMPDGKLAFRLLRHGDEIGRHTLAFDRNGDRLTVQIAVDARVTIMSIPFVRYSHRVEETWSGARLVALTGDTDKNGAREWVRAQRTSEGLVVAGSRTRQYVAPDSAIPTSYWNRRMLEGPMISLEDGVLLNPKVSPATSESVRLASGAVIPAEHYRLSGAFDVDVWYDLTPVWAGLAFSVADGSEVHYERL